MILLIPESNKPKKKRSVKHTPYELGVKEGKEVDKMNRRQREKEEYSFYVTGVTLAVVLALVIYALVKQIFFK